MSSFVDEWVCKKRRKSRDFEFWVRIFGYLIKRSGRSQAKWPSLPQVRSQWIQHGETIAWHSHPLIFPFSRHPVPVGGQLDAGAAVVRPPQADVALRQQHPRRHHRRRRRLLGRDRGLHRGNGTGRISFGTMLTNLTLVLGVPSAITCELSLALSLGSSPGLPDSCWLRYYCLRLSITDRTCCSIN